MKGAAAEPYKEFPAKATGNNRFDAGIALGLTFEYRRFIIGAETQVGLVKVNEQINQMIGHSEEGGYFPKNFAAFFTLGYRFW